MRERIAAFICSSSQWSPSGVPDRITPNQIGWKHRLGQGRKIAVG
jgi:hypothetical protein